MLKIVSWNCRGEFREKYLFIQRQDADAYVIQECENPEKYKKQFSGFYSNHSEEWLKYSDHLPIQLEVK